MSVKCAECLCIPEECSRQNAANCTVCIKDDCCCIEIHLKDSKRVLKFFGNVKDMYASALAIEILCIMSAEIGENTSFFLLGYKTVSGISIAFVLGYGLAGFTTFATILGRYNLDKVMDGCCSALDCQDNGFTSSLKTSFRNFALGVSKIPYLYKQPHAKQILKTSLYVLLVSESFCILTAETVDLIFYRHSLWLSIPLSLFAGAFAITALEAYRKTKATIN